MAAKRVYFRLKAPDADQVVVVGSFNGWDPSGRPLKKGVWGVWRTHVLLEPGVYEYRFRVDGEWRNDPESEAVPNPYGTLNNLRVVQA